MHNHLVLSGIISSQEDLLWHYPFLKSIPGVSIGVGYRVPGDEDSGKDRDWGVEGGHGG